MSINQSKRLCVAVLLLGTAMLLLGTWQNAVAAPGDKPDIVILATGGTIAGAAATGTQSGTVCSAAAP